MDDPGLVDMEAAERARRSFLANGSHVAMPRDEQTTRILALVLRALNERAYAWASLALVAAAWGFVLVSYAPLWPTVCRIVAATIFSAFVLAPSWRRKER